MTTNLLEKIYAVVVICVFLFSVNVPPCQVVQSDTTVGNLAGLITNLQVLEESNQVIAAADFALSLRKVLSSMRSVAGLDVLAIYDPDANQESEPAILLVTKSSPYIMAETVVSLPVSGDAAVICYYPDRYNSPPAIPELPPPITVRSSLS